MDAREIKFDVDYVVKVDDAPFTRELLSGVSWMRTTTIIVSGL